MIYPVKVCFIGRINEGTVCDSGAAFRYFDCCKKHVNWKINTLESMNIVGRYLVMINNERVNKYLSLHKHVFDPLHKNCILFDLKK